MISEKRLASAYTSFWQALLPMGDSVVRAINLGKERFCEPLKSAVESDRRALVNEIGFRLFAASVEGGQVVDSRPSGGAIHEISQNARNYVARLKSSAPEAGLRPVAPNEQEEAQEIARRLRLFFGPGEFGASLIVGPRFPGCGVLRECEGDVLARDALYEIKAGDRDFRLVDVRQLIVYFALNYQERAYDIHALGLLNPRRGVFFHGPAAELVQRASGNSAVEVVAQVMAFLSAPEASR